MTHPNGHASTAAGLGVQELDAAGGRSREFVHLRVGDNEGPVARGGVHELDTAGGGGRELVPVQERIILYY